MTTRSLKRPGGAPAIRSLHFIFVADCSGSMNKAGKIQALNRAISDAIPKMRLAAEANSNARMLVRALCFSTRVHWHIATPTPVREFEWEEIRAGGETNMGKAMGMVAEAMRVLNKGERVFPPVLVLITDGRPTDDFDAGLSELLSEPLGHAAVRLAIGIGEDADMDRLQEFIADKSRRPVQANNPEELISYIQWASVAVPQSVCSPVSEPGTARLPRGGGQGPIPKAPGPRPPTTDGPVWGEDLSCSE